MRIDGWLRNALGCGLLAAALVGAPAEAARVVDVRIGRHDDFTRVVFELDAPAPYRREDVRRPGVGREVVVKLEASATARALGSTSPLVESVSLEPEGSSSVARIRLRAADVRVVETRLSSPPRIVVDVRRAATATVQKKPAPATKAAAGVAAPAVAAAGTQPSFEQEAPRPRLTEEEIERALLEAAPGAGRPAAPKPAPAPQPAPAAVGAEAAAPPGTEAVPAPPAEPSAVGVADAPAPPPEGGAVAEAAATTEASATEEGVAGEKETEAASGAAEPAPLASEPARAEPAPLAPEPLPAEPAPLAPPAEPALETAPALPPDMLPLAFVVAGIAVLLLVWRLLRRRGQDARSVSPMAEARSRALEERAATAGALDSAGATEAAPVSGIPPRAAEALAEALAEAEAEDSEDFATAVPEPEPGYLLDDALGEIEPAVVEEAPVRPAAALQPAASTESALQRSLHELERRLGQIETRLEQILEGRDRVERQLAAQTEELRVQRAAIARTQRVLRTVVRPDDVATEPVPRDPSRGAPG